MIDKKQIPALVKELTDRKVHLYHACQLRDLLTYLKIGGVPSREVLDAAGPYTPFDTDRTDKDHHVWDKVFFNMEDFGTTFAKGYGATPNPFGPILLVFDPEVLTAASDVAVCIKSAGARDFDRQKDAILATRIADLFQEPVGNSKEGWFRTNEGLKEVFEVERASKPEVSCTYVNGHATYTHLTKIWVDPYSYKGSTLRDEVAAVVNGKLPGPIEQRTVKDRGGWYDIFANRAKIDPGDNLTKIKDDKSVQDGVREWALKLIDRKLEWQYRRFIKYLGVGTLGISPP